MLKHVGRHGDKKVVIVFRTVPGEDHMALVIYPDNLNATIHDDLMNAVQSNEGQAATNLGDALFRIKGTSGDSILHTIHREGFIKKVRTQDVIMVPAPNQQGARLDEINKIISQLDEGAEGAAKLAELDATAGLADPDKKAAGIEAARAVTRGSDTDGVLADTDIARNLVKQAEDMKLQTKSMETEAERLLQEARELDPNLKRGPGRPKKVETAPVKETHDTMLQEENKESA